MREAKARIASGISRILATAKAAREAAFVSRSAAPGSAGDLKRQAPAMKVRMPEPTNCTPMQTKRKPISFEST